MMHAAEWRDIPIRDEQLMGAVAQGDQRAFEAIYQRYAPAVFGLALKTLRDREAAEEAVQEGFWRVWQRAESFDPGAAFAPWLFRIARNCCMDELRRRRLRPHLIQDDEHPVLSMIGNEADVCERVLQAEQHQTVAQALEQLPVEQRQALELAYYAGLTQQEIANHLGTPLGTIKTRTRLGLQKLRTILQASGLSDA